MATASVPDHLADAARWTVPVPDYVALQGVVGGAAPSNQTACKDAVTAQSTRSPLVILFVVQGDEDHIHIGHSATAFPTDLLDPACPFNNHTIVISCDSQSCFCEVETIDKQTFWNVPNRVDPLDSLVGLDF